jgi:hypothetical protein
MSSTTVLERALSHHSRPSIAATMATLPSGACGSTQVQARVGLGGCPASQHVQGADAHPGGVRPAHCSSRPGPGIVLRAGGACDPAKQRRGGRVESLSACPSPHGLEEVDQGLGRAVAVAEALSE